MGWASASYIFNDVARSVTGWVDAGQMSSHAAMMTLEMLARRLMDDDWDTVDESWRAFDAYPYVQVALTKAGYIPEPVDDEN